MLDIWIPYSQTTVVVSIATTFTEVVKTGADFQAAGWTTPRNEKDFVRIVNETGGSTFSVCFGVGQTALTANAPTVSTTGGAGILYLPYDPSWILPTFNFRLYNYGSSNMSIVVELGYFAG